MVDAIKEVSCIRCLHQEVCKYKQDFLDICNAVSSSTVNRPCEDGKKVKTTYYKLRFPGWYSDRMSLLSGASN